MYSRPLPHIGDVAPSFRTVRKKEGGEVGRWVCVCGGGGVLAQGHRLGSPRRPHMGKREDISSVMQHEQRKKKSQTGAAPMLPRRKMFFALFVARGQHGCCQPRQAGCTGIKEYIVTEETTQAGVNRKKGRGAATAGHFCNNPNT